MYGISESGGHNLIILLLLIPPLDCTSNCEVSGYDSLSDTYHAYRSIIFRAFLLSPKLSCARLTNTIYIFAKNSIGSRVDVIDHMSDQTISGGAVRYYICRTWYHTYLLFSVTASDRNCTLFVTEGVRCRVHGFFVTEEYCMVLA